jgi:3-isopropylmalate/(R)-2-methylmalate dehydratase small subunit
MEPFIHHAGLAIPLDRPNVNTDDIVPARFLKTIKRSGFEGVLFANWRYLNDDRLPNPDFVLNLPRYQGGSILISRENFGCGSSREHAPWSLHDYGIRAILAPSFADIFYNNCLNNCILPVILPEQTIRALLDETEKQEGYTLTIDLPAQTVVAPNLPLSHFELDGFRKQALLQGLDNIGWTLSHASEIRAYEQRYREEEPWRFLPTSQAHAAGVH